MNLELHDTHASPRTKNGVERNAARAKHSSKQNQYAALAHFPDFQAGESVGVYW
jgi:hypothetical protein